MRNTAIAPRWTLTVGLLLCLAAAPLQRASHAGTAATHPLDNATTAGRDSNLRLRDLTPPLLAHLETSSAQLDEAASEAEKTLRRFLEAEIEGRYKDAFELFFDGFSTILLQDRTNQAIVNDIRLYQTPPGQPQTHEKEAIDRVAALVRDGKLALEQDEPALWAYQWTHSTGTVDADFPVTGPYANEYRLVEFQIVRLVLANPSLAVAWVLEDIGIPAGLRVSQISQFMLRPDEEGWRIWSYRTMDGPRLESWLGKRACLWPDQLAAEIGLEYE